MESKRKILFVAAEPIGLPVTYWQKEYKSIIDVFNFSKLKDYCLLEAEFDTKSNDFLLALEREPWLIHFSGHGTQDGNLVFVDKHKEKFTARTRDLIPFFEESKTLKCVLFCSCHSSKLVEETKKVVEYSIGFEGPVENEDAIAFISQFYRNLSLVKTIDAAFNRAVNVFSFNKYQGEVKPILQLRKKYLIEEIMKNNNQEARLELERELSAKKKWAEETQQEIAMLEIDMRRLVKLDNEVAEANEELISEFNKLKTTSPHPSGVFWFFENKNNIVKQLSERLLFDKTEQDREYFAEELDILFDFLSTSLAMEGTSKFTKANLNGVRTFPKSAYKKAFDDLKNLVPESKRTEGFMAFLQDNVRYIKNLI